MIMEIRRATEKDVLQLSKLFRQNIEYLQGLAGYYELLPNFDWVAYTEEKLKDRNRLILVAGPGEDLTGYIVASIMNYPSINQHKSILRWVIHHVKKKNPLPIKPVRWGFIEDCYVVPSLRKQGFGSQLVLNAMKWFQSKQINRIELSLIARNKEGEAFWKKSGFKTFRLSLSKEI